MADHFQNGLYLARATADQVGRTFSRWLVEFATQICGWTLNDSYSVGSGSYTATRGTGTNGASVAATPQQFDITGDAYTFTSGVDEGRYLTITGFPAGFEDRDGIYRIVNVVSSKIVELDIRFSMHDAGIPHPSTGLAWRLWGPETTDIPSHNVGSYATLQGTGTQGGAYNFHVRLITQTGFSDLPTVEVGPWGNWTPGAPGSWSDSRYTTAYHNWSAAGIDYARVWAVGDSDRIFVAFRNLDPAPIVWSILYIGEIDAHYDNTIDPRPVMMYAGYNSNDIDACFGYGGNYLIYQGGRGLAENDTLTLTYVSTFHQVSPYLNLPWTVGNLRRWSSRTRRIYRQAWMMESRTASHFELRGSLRRLWLGGTNLWRATPFGRNAEFLHIVGGIIMPWNGSAVHEQRV